MLDARTYSITEMEQLSGFDRRTIVYYIQQGLVPKPGRRGPNTRYPEDCLLRLRFVRGLKDQQDQGRCGTVTLADIRVMLGALDPPALRGLVEQGVPVADVERLLRPPAPPPEPPLPASNRAAAAPSRPTIGDGRSYGLADAGIRQRTVVASQATAEPPAAHDDTHPRLPALTVPPPGAPAGAGGTGIEPGMDPAIGDNLGELLRQLEVRPSLTGRRLPPGASEQWTEIPITSRVFLSVRGLSENDAPLADAVARALKKVLRTR